MSKLTAKARAKIPGKKFAGPGRSFPVEDKGHARAALIDVGKAVRAGHISSAEAEHIRAMARSELKG
jgi:hypothetical protein